MSVLRFVRASSALALSSAIALSPAHALVNIDEGRNQIFINSTVSIGYDSNLFANATGGSDYIYGVIVGAEYVRRAGLIGVNASVSVNATEHENFENENFQNPSYRLELTKQSGRTTGAIVLAAARQSRADSAANIRSKSWNYDAGLNFKYPVIERYSFTGNITYNERDFIDNSLLVDRSQVSAGLDLFYMFTTDRDLLAGYRYRHERSSIDTENEDHAFTIGVTGKILPRLHGAVRFGYQIRSPLGTNEDDFSSWTTSASLTYTYNQRVTLTALFVKDFSTTSTNISVDTMTASLEFQYAVNSRTTLQASTGVGQNDFLGVLGAGRRDQYWTWSVGLNRTITEHLKASLNYLSYENWSTLAFADYDRTMYSLSISARY